ncbi:hypothetical protein [Peribacillus asahii]|uniref:hypothetical protein n=1 Tax=Peribacillus asahii TaxID=228899 RepID=UPI0037F584FA
MKITEIEWIKQNRDRLDEEDIKALNGFNFFEQLENGELDLPLPKMLELMKLTMKIHEKHTVTS